MHSWNISLISLSLNLFLEGNTNITQFNQSYKFFIIFVNISSFMNL
ncbi:hypothetical protein A0H76_3045 [Hepatospora eriocheir]|uniref:Uncharacterized protein n=1 Tax=Hepatospora eriocheir TaxID=1081669 RepID=A0A1X0QG34_9MICR|nr:hypothetical protein A0H76_3045 [Hepatospora eriocheir]